LSYRWYLLEEVSEYTLPILDWPAPTTVKEVQSFLGLANFYRRFLKNFAKIAYPLNKLTRKNVPFVWSKDANDSFEIEILKRSFISAPILIPADPNSQYFVETDASNFALRCILSQVSSKDNKLHPIAFYSIAFTSAECNYPIYDKELLAIKTTFETWRYYLEGAKKTIKILTDHRNLLYFKKPEQLSQRLIRWSIFFTRFDFQIEYRPGSRGGKPDALSRRSDYDNHEPAKPYQVLKPENFCFTSRISFESNLQDEIKKYYSKDSFFNNVKIYFEKLSANDKPIASNFFRSSMILFYMTILFIFLNALDLKSFVHVMIPLLMATLA